MPRAVPDTTAARRLDAWRCHVRSELAKARAEIWALNRRLGTNAQFRSQVDLVGQAVTDSRTSIERQIDVLHELGDISAARYSEIREGRVAVRRGPQRPAIKREDPPMDRSNPATAWDGRGLLSSVDVATYLNIPVHTLDQWSHRKKGPPFIRVGRHRRYRQQDVEAWLESQSHGGEGVTDAQSQG